MLHTFYECWGTMAQAGHVCYSAVVCCGAHWRAAAQPVSVTTTDCVSVFRAISGARFLLALGHESRGLPESWLERGHVLTLPLHIESLGVAVCLGPACPWAQPCAYTDTSLRKGCPLLWTGLLFQQAKSWCCVGIVGGRCHHPRPSAGYVFTTRDWFERCLAARVAHCARRGWVVVGTPCRP